MENSSEKQNRLLLPKAYLSPSQISLWKSSPERYRSEYFAKGRRLKTKYLEFGNRVHKMIEDGTYRDVLPHLTVYSERELEITCEVNGVPIFAIIDGYEPEPHVFGDYKTGKSAWTQAKVQKHDQFLIYAVVLRKVKGVMPRYCETHWLETAEGGDGGDFWDKVDSPLRLTGHNRTFRRYFDERELDRMEADILRVALEISDAYRKFISEM